jgi:type II secretory pathway component PulF
MKGISPVVIGLAAIFVAIFMLFYIFDTLDKLSERCQAGDQIPLCSQFTSMTFSMLIILLVISGFVITVCITVYILVSV